MCLYMGSHDWWLAQTGRSVGHPPSAPSAPEPRAAGRGPRAAGDRLIGRRRGGRRRRRGRGRGRGRWMMMTTTTIDDDLDDDVRVTRRTSHATFRA